MWGRDGLVWIQGFIYNVVDLLRNVEAIREKFRFVRKGEKGKTE